MPSTKYLPAKVLIIPVAGRQINSNKQAPNYKGIWLLIIVICNLFGG